MDSRIGNYIIPEQVFELVRDQIGAILFLELSKQKELQKLTESIELYSERSTPADAADEVYINVLVGGADYDTLTRRNAIGTVNYLIDVYTTGEYDPDLDKQGFTVSGTRLHKYAGMCMYIFRTAQWKDLGLPKGHIGGVYVQRLEVLDPHQRDDSSYTRFCRVHMAVRVLEETKPATGLILFGNDTIVKLDLTEKGYKFVHNKP